MNHSDLKIIQGCDLNLLLSLTVLIEEGSVSKSAERLDISQPAMSQNLKKIRNLFDEPLFVKHGQGIKATEKARSLLPGLHEWLEMSSRLILQKAFDPKEVYGVVRIAFIDTMTSEIVPQLLEMVMQAAPNVELEFIHKPKHMFSMLESGELDLCIGGTETPPANIYGRKIGLERFCIASSPTHPINQLSNPSLADIFSFETAEYSASNAAEPQITQLAQANNLNRKVSFSTSSMLVLRNGLLAGKHIAFISDIVTQNPYWKDKLSILKHEALPEVESTLYWHARVHQDPLVQWFKNRCLELASGFREQGLYQPA
ncbi:LysR family transcriptional regulator [Shewanella woodyi]|uniref:Transcriptional regulator, LysR family n=1 Tax=Shewanella woodyi (strain ATCC 51908 / MS32) TaxID=392500 RepID=B1KKW0_SHEWM|nr:LysR family transcriptional regulator [Shewanella woodyi]ACA88766.1 transcriptional regulator, LysR family [Shewanella woodyi ATCC 51908]